eukprot:gene11273-7837_t
MQLQSPKPLGTTIQLSNCSQHLHNHKLASEGEKDGLYSHSNSDSDSTLLYSDSESTLLD